MADTPETLTMTLDGGDVTIKLRPDLAPKHVERIVELANDGFYDGVVFHRVIPGFMAQGGDPTGTGMHGSDKGNLKAEFSKEPHVRGVCSMARTNQPDTANSQFFIVFDDAKFLDGQYTVWGASDRRHGPDRRAAQGRAAARAGQDREDARGIISPSPSCRAGPGIQGHMRYACALDPETSPG